MGGWRYDKGKDRAEQDHIVNTSFINTLSENRGSIIEIGTTLISFSNVQIKQIHNKKKRKTERKSRAVQDSSYHPAWNLSGLS
jgi:hypothetical protein